MPGVWTERVEVAERGLNTRAEVHMMGWWPSTHNARVLIPGEVSKEEIA